MSCDVGEMTDRLENELCLDKSRIQAAEMQFLRSIVQKTRQDRIRNEEMRNTLKIGKLQDVLDGNRNRGSVRYGSPNNVGLNESTFPLPPSATAWTLVTLKGPGNESRSSRQPIQNNTSAINSTTRVVATSVNWSPVRGKRPWSTVEAGK